MGGRTKRPASRIDAATGAAAAISRESNINISTAQKIEQRSKKCVSENVHQQTRKVRGKRGRRSHEVRPPIDVSPPQADGGSLAPDPNSSESLVIPPETPSETALPIPKGNSRDILCLSSSEICDERTCESISPPEPVENIKKRPCGTVTNITGLQSEKKRVRSDELFSYSAVVVRSRDQHQRQYSHPMCRVSRYSSPKEGNYVPSVPGPVFEGEEQAPSATSSAQNFDCKVDTALRQFASQESSSPTSCKLPIISANSFSRRFGSHACLTPSDQVRLLCRRIYSTADVGVSFQQAHHISSSFTTRRRTCKSENSQPETLGDSSVAREESRESFQLGAPATTGKGVLQKSPWNYSPAGSSGPYNALIPPHAAVLLRSGRMREILSGSKRNDAGDVTASLESLPTNLASEVLSIVDATAENTELIIKPLCDNLIKRRSSKFPGLDLPFCNGYFRTPLPETGSEPDATTVKDPGCINNDITTISTGDLATASLSEENEDQSTFSYKLTSPNHGAPGSPGKEVPSEHLLGEAEHPINWRGPKKHFEDEICDILSYNLSGDEEEDFSSEDNSSLECGTKLIDGPVITAANCAAAPNEPTACATDNVLLESSKVEIALATQKVDGAQELLTPESQPPKVILPVAPSLVSNAQEKDNKTINSPRTITQPEFNSPLSSARSDSARTKAASSSSDPTLTGGWQRDFSFAPLVYSTDRFPNYECPIPGRKGSQTLPDNEELLETCYGFKARPGFALCLKTGENEEFPSPTWGRSSPDHVPSPLSAAEDGCSTTTGASSSHHFIAGSSSAGSSLEGPSIKELPKSDVESYQVKIANDLPGDQEHFDCPEQASERENGFELDESIEGFKHDRDEEDEAKAILSSKSYIIPTHRTTVQDDEEPSKGRLAALPPSVRCSQKRELPIPKYLRTTSKVFVSSVSFNQDNSCFTAATTVGFRVFYCSPIMELARREVGTSFDAGGGSPVNCCLPFPSPRLAPLINVDQSSSSVLDKSRSNTDVTTVPQPRITLRDTCSRGSSTQEFPDSQANSDWQGAGTAGTLSQCEPAYVCRGPKGLGFLSKQALAAGNFRVNLSAMLFRSYTYALVTSAEPNQVKLWNDRSQRVIGTLRCRRPVINLLVRREIIIPVTDSTIYVYRSGDLTPLQVIPTGPNPLGLVAISTTGTPWVIVCPAITPGAVRIVTDPASNTAVNSRSLPSSGTSSLTDEAPIVAVHQNSLGCLSISADGLIFGTASVLGTVLKILSSKTGALLRVLRLGTIPHEVRCISFRDDNRFVAVTSNSRTVHLFNLQTQPTSSRSSPLEQSDQRQMGTGSSLFSSLLCQGTGFVKGTLRTVLPKYFAPERAFATYSLPAEFEMDVRSNTRVSLTHHVRETGCVVCAQTLDDGPTAAREQAPSGSFFRDAFLLSSRFKPQLPASAVELSDQDDFVVPVLSRTNSSISGTRSGTCDFQTTLFRGPICAFAPRPQPKSDGERDRLYVVHHNGFIYEVHYDSLDGGPGRLLKSQPWFAPRADFNLLTAAAQCVDFPSESLDTEVLETPLDMLRSELSNLAPDYSD